MQVSVRTDLNNDWKCEWIESGVGLLGHFWHQLQSFGRAASRPISSTNDVQKGMKRQLTSRVSPVIQSLNEPRTLPTRPDVSHLQSLLPTIINQTTISYKINLHGLFSFPALAFPASISWHRYWETVEALSYSDSKSIIAHYMFRVKN